MLIVLIVVRITMILNNVIMMTIMMIVHVIITITVVVRKVMMIIITMMILVINNGNRTEWSPFQSVIMREISKNRTTAKQESDLSITSVIIDTIGRHKVLFQFIITVTISEDDKHIEDKYLR